MPVFRTLVRSATVPFHFHFSPMTSQAESGIRKTVSPMRGVLLRALALVAAFSLLAGDYLFDYFSSDDFMNLAHSLHQGWASVRGVALFWSGDVSRPVGDLIYGSLYALFGFHPFPFKLVMLLLLAGNVFIAWRVAALVLRNSSLGALAALLVLYHASEKGDIWYNFGNFSAIYDILCFTFMYSALWMWLHVRREGRFPRASAIALMAALEILALGAKEMAVAFPVLVFLYELFWGGLMPWGKRQIEWKAIPAIALFAVIPLVFMIGKSRGSASLLNDPLYWPVFSLHVYFQNMSHYLNLLFYSGGLFRAGRTTSCLVGGLVIASVFRARAMAFGWLWFLVAILPVALIPPRGGSVLYIPALGLAVAVVDVLRVILDAVKTKVGGWAQPLLNPGSTPVFLLALICMTSLHWHFKQAADAASKRLSAQYRSFAADLKRDGGHGSSVLFLRDPFGLDRYDPQYIASLVRGDRDLRVGRAKSNQALLSPAVAAMYDDVFDFDNGRLDRVPKRDLSLFVDRLRSRSGYVDPVSGLYLTADGWWWTKKEFVVAARCPVTQNHCEVVFDLSGPAVAAEGSWKVSVDVGRVHWSDLSLSALSQPSGVPVSLPGSEHATPVRFVIDRAVPLSALHGVNREQAIILSGVHVH